MYFDEIERWESPAWITSAGRGQKTWTLLRRVYKLDAQNPGSDVASETAAALAAASMVFKKTEGSYSKLLLQTAVRMKSLYLNECLIQL